MTDTTNLALPLIAAAQAQKHVTHNEALERLDALVQMSVTGVETDPPASPVEGQRFICAASATGAWVGRDNNIAAWQGGGWVFYVPATGWRTWVSSETTLKVFDGTSWNAVSGGGGATNFQNVPEIGVNATADATNRLSVNSANTLFNHEGDDHRLKINRATTSDTASVVFQSGFSGRAEFGNTGSDQFRLRVSADGVAWTDAWSVDPATGKTDLSLAEPNVGQIIEQGHASDPLIFPYGQFGYSSASLGFGTPTRRYKLPVFIPVDTTVSRIVFNVRTAGAVGARVRVGLRRWDRSAGWSFRELILETPEVDAETTGVKDISVGSQDVPAGWYVLDVACNDSTVAMSGYGWNYIGAPVFGSQITSGYSRGIAVLYEHIAYGSLAADSLGVTYSVPHFSTANFCIGIG